MARTNQLLIIVILLAVLASMVLFTLPPTRGGSSFQVSLEDRGLDHGSNDRNKQFRQISTAPERRTDESIAMSDFQNVDFSAIVWIHRLNYRVKSQNLMRKAPKEDATEEALSAYADAMSIYQSMQSDGWIVEHPAHVVDIAWAKENLGVTDAEIIAALQQQFVHIDPQDSWIKKTAKKVKFVAVWGFCRSGIVCQASKEAGRDPEKELIPCMVRQFETAGAFYDAQTAENEGALLGKRQTTFADKLNAAYRRVELGMPLAQIRPYRENGKDMPSRMGLSARIGQYVQGLVYLAQAIGLDKAQELLTRKDAPLNPRKWSKPNSLVDALLTGGVLKKTGKANSIVESAIDKTEDIVESFIATSATGRGPGAITVSTWQATQPKAAKTSPFGLIRSRHIKDVNGFESLGPYWGILTTPINRLEIVTVEERAALEEMRAATVK